MLRVFPSMCKTLGPSPVPPEICHLTAVKAAALFTPSHPYTKFSTSEHLHHLLALDTHNSSLPPPEGSQERKEMRPETGVQWQPCRTHPSQALQVGELLVWPDKALGASGKAWLETRTLGLEGFPFQKSPPRMLCSLCIYPLILEQGTYTGDIHRQRHLVSCVTCTPQGKGPGESEDSCWGFSSCKTSSGAVCPRLSLTESRNFKMEIHICHRNIISRILQIYTQLQYCYNNQKQKQMKKFN